MTTLETSPAVYRSLSKVTSVSYRETLEYEATGTRGSPKGDAKVFSYSNYSSFLPPLFSQTLFCCCGGVCVTFSMLSGWWLINLNRQRLILLLSVKRYGANTSARVRGPEAQGRQTRPVMSKGKWKVAHAAWGQPGMGFNVKLIYMLTTFGQKKTSENTCLLKTHFSVCFL